MGVIPLPAFGEPIPGVTYWERPAAYAIVFAPDGLGVGVIDFNGRLFLPGGGSETPGNEFPEGETPEETIHREVREELDCAVRLLLPLGSAVQYFSADDTHYRMAATFFLAEFIGEPRSVEHPFLYVPFPESVSRFRHECHVWAIQEARRQIAADSRIERKEIGVVKRSSDGARL